MRTIKFRAWDNKNNKMVNPENLVFWNGCCYLNESGTLNNPEKPYSSAKLKGYTILEKYVMQFTGLLDKNGKEIYEGDIVKFRANYTNKAGGDQIAQVVMTEYHLELHNSNGQYDALEETDESPNIHWKVIGNIYENPELIQSNVADN